MTDYLGVIGVVTVAAITPGPNNLIVLRAASRDGIRGAVPAILGVVTGGLALLSVVLLATRAAFALDGQLRTAVALVGAGYLAWLGLGLIRHAGRSARGAPELPAPSMFGLLAFQVVNPKCWMLVLTAIGAAPAGRTAWPLAIVFTAIPTACLLAWAVAGAVMARTLARPAVAVWVDRAMAAVLLLTAVEIAVS
jgi:threonine/homoserine/homoserine lactone efflux protein